MLKRRVTVIIPNYNYGIYLPKAIESVLNQTYQNLELIVVNNGSTDNSLAVLKSYSNEIRLINQENLGQSGARNSGLRASKGDLIAFLDADDFWEANKIEKQIELIRPNYELVYSGYKELDNESSRDFRIVKPIYRDDCQKTFLQEICASVVLGGESTALFTKNLQERVGLFDHNLNSAAGWDFFRRCSRLTNFDFVDEPLSNYRIHDNNMSKAFKANANDIRAAYLKFISDPEWAITNNQHKFIMQSLEWNLCKTSLRSHDFANGMKSLGNIIKYISKY